VTALADYRDESDLPLLRKLATDTDSGVRWRAAEALGKFHQPGDIPLLRKMALKNQSGALDSLLRFPPELIVGTLRDFSKHRNAGLRCNLALALGDWSQPESSLLLRNLAQDADPIVRSVAVSSLGALGDAHHLPLLRELTEDESAEVRREAVWAVGQFRQAEDIELFKRCLNDKVVEVRTLAARMLSLLYPGPALGEWFKGNSFSLSLEALKEIDYRLYAPAWLRKAEQRADDDYSLMELGVYRHCEKRAL
jgi:HEAT repeat protein